MDSSVAIKLGDVIDISNFRPRPHVYAKTQRFLSGFAFSPHVSGEYAHRKRNLSKTVSRVETFENATLAFSCGRMKTEPFENDDVTVSNPVHPRASVHW